MLLTLTSELLKKAVAIHIAKKYGVSSEDIKNVRFNEESMLTGSFEDKPFGDTQSNDTMIIKIEIKGVEFTETITDPSYLDNVSKSFISNILTLDENAFTIEETFFPDETKNPFVDFESEDIKIDKELITVNFYLNEDEE